MKKLTALLLTLCMAVALAACGTEGASTTPANDAPAPQETTETTAEPEAAAEEPAAEADGLVYPSIEDLFVGFSQADLASTWRTVESDHMQQIADERNYNIAITNAEGDTERQISDVESLLAQGCNVMVIVAIDADAIQPALDTCRERGVPVIMKARGSNGTPGVDFVTSIMSDFVWQGEQAAGYALEAAEKLGIENIRAIEIQGVIGGSDVRDRSAGFHNLADPAGVEFIAQQSANWSRSEAQEVVQNLIQSTGGEFDVIYCHNDEMALGASLALQAAGLKVNEDVILIGVDGMIEALDAIKEGNLSTSVTCTPKYADLVFDTIEKLIAGETVDTDIAVQDVVVTIDNVEEFYELGF